MIGIKGMAFLATVGKPVIKAGTFGWKGKAKDYPGAANIKRGLVKKGKPKLKIV